MKNLKKKYRVYFDYTQKNGVFEEKDSSDFTSKEEALKHITSLGKIKDGEASGQWGEDCQGNPYDTCCCYIEEIYKKEENKSIDLELASKIIIVEPNNAKIKIIHAMNINLDCLEENHDNDLESYLTDEHGYDSSSMHYFTSEFIDIEY